MSQVYFGIILLIDNKRQNFVLNEGKCIFCENGRSNDYIMSITVKPVFRGQCSISDTDTDTI